jgi:hypothetical protein
MSSALRGRLAPAEEASWKMNGKHLLPMILIAGALTVAAAIPASATPTTVTFHLDGIHPADKDAHQGAFTAPSPLCSSGTWQGNGQNSRVFTCADDSGTFTARFNGELEHTSGASGPWSIIGGTGAYATLRGTGTAHIDSSTGPTGDPITFSDTWTGRVDFDTVPPSGSITAAKVVRPHAPHGLWTVQAAFTARDNVAENAVRFRATAQAGVYFAERRGSLVAGSRKMRFAFRPGRRVRSLKLRIELSDPWENQSILRRTVRLR